MEGPLFLNCWLNTENGDDFFSELICISFLYLMSISWRQRLSGRKERMRRRLRQCRAYLQRRGRKKNEHPRKRLDGWTDGCKDGGTEGRKNRAMRRSQKKTRSYCVDLCERTRMGRQGSQDGHYFWEEAMMQNSGKDTAMPRHTTPRNATALRLIGYLTDAVYAALFASFDHWFIRFFLPLTQGCQAFSSCSRHGAIAQTDLFQIEINSKRLLFLDTISKNVTEMCNTVGITFHGNMK